MEKLFNNILVPLALWENADSAIQKAVDIANRWQCHLHLLLFAKASAGEGNGLATIKSNIHQLYQRKLDPALSLSICIREGQPEKFILEYYRKNDIDLILLARAEGGFWIAGRSSFAVRANRLMKKVACPVLNIALQTGASDSASDVFPMKNIVLPVGELLPMRKLIFAAYLARPSHSTIHLVSTADRNIEPRGKQMASLQKAYLLLHENTNLAIECQALAGGNLAEAAWVYAKKIKADLILIGPGKESLMSGFINALSSRSLFNVSRIPVMTVG